MPSVGDGTSSKRIGRKESVGKISSAAMKKRRYRLYTKHRVMFANKDNDLKHLRIPKWLQEISTDNISNMRSNEKEMESANDEIVTDDSKLNASDAARANSNDAINDDIDIDVALFGTGSNNRGNAKINNSSENSDEFGGNVSHDRSTKNNDRENINDASDDDYCFNYGVVNDNVKKNNDDDGHDDNTIDESENDNDDEIVDVIQQDEPTNIASVFALNVRNNLLSGLTKFKNFITDIHIILWVIAFSIRSKLTYASIVTLFKSITYMTQSTVFPVTKKSLWKLLARSDRSGTLRHYYCRVCLDCIGSGERPESDCSCGRCGPYKVNKSMSYFIQLEIIPQLRQLLSDPVIVKSLGYRFTRTKNREDAMEDIYDGSEYNKLCRPNGFLNYQYNFSFGIFTDGVQVAKSSKASAWPVMLTINEFSPHARKKHLLLAGLWVDTVHPNLNSLLFPIVQELQYLHNTGLTWKNPIDGEMVTSKFVTLICTLDSVARSSFMNMTQYNGEYGCTFCYAKGQLITRGNTRKRVYPFKAVPEKCRTDKEIRRDMKKAEKEDRKVNGVKGYATIGILRQLDCGRSIIVDNMHNVYLGVVKRHMQLLLDSDAKSRWYAGSPRNIRQINKRLMSIRPPNSIARNPRPIETMKTWKASEWRNWIQFYALPCLKNIVREIDFNHIALLSQAVTILNQDSIDNEELLLAKKLLTMYRRRYEKIFRTDNMSYNIHLLEHLTDSVSYWGPFWTHGAFPYESWNKKLMDKITSPHGRALQVVTRYFLERFIEVAMNSPEIPQNVKQMVDSILNSGFKRKKIFIDPARLEMSEFRVIDCIEQRQPNDKEIKAFAFAGYDEPPSIVSFYKRAFIKHTDYMSCEWRKRKIRNCNEYIYFERIRVYGRIVRVVTFGNTDGSMVAGFLVQKLNINGNAFGQWSKHILNFSTTRTILFVPHTVNGPRPLPAIVMMTVDGQETIAKLPNLWETD